MVFAMIEGLKTGETINLIYDYNPEEIHHAISNSPLKHINCQLMYDSARDKWVMTISKKEIEKVKQDHGCCGICGSHS
jgi:uncharacterized protein (DUF2249 family)